MTCCLSDQRPEPPFILHAIAGGDVEAFTDVDLYAMYAFTKNFSLHGSILNVFGTQPPVDLTTYGGSGNDPYNPAMHQMGAVGRFFNVGGTYTF